MFKCHSIHEGAYMSPPYACAYSNSAKNGQGALLAVSTEQGAVYIVDTSKRREWDVGAFSSHLISSSFVLS